jgi:DNA-binding transcriptional ArsR family regulator
MTSTRNSVAARLAGSAPIFAALGDETRLMIVARLCDGVPLSITRLAEGSTISRQAITKHLHALEQAGLAGSFRFGRQCLWELRARKLSEARRSLEQISAQWDAAIDRLRAHVEKDQE